jgi:hypothetical protein
MRTALGVAYVIAFLVAITLPFVAFGATGLLVLVPTALWLASGLRAQTRRSGNFTDGVVGWPGLTAAAFGVSSFALTTVGGRALNALWLAAVALCGVIELTRARVAKTDNLRSESQVQPRRS